MHFRETLSFQDSLIVGIEFLVLELAFREQPSETARRREGSTTTTGGTRCEKGKTDSINEDGDERPQNQFGCAPKKNRVASGYGHGRTARANAGASCTRFPMFFRATPCAPDQTSCRPAQIAITATTDLRRCAGTLRANKQPRITPGMPPMRS